MNSPWAMLTISMIPQTRVSPRAARPSTLPMSTPLMTAGVMRGSAGKARRARRGGRGEGGPAILPRAGSLLELVHREAQLREIPELRRPHGDRAAVRAPLGHDGGQAPILGPVHEALLAVPGLGPDEGRGPHRAAGLADLLGVQRAGGLDGPLQDEPRI